MKEWWKDLTFGEKFIVIFVGPPIVSICVLVVSAMIRLTAKIWSL